MTDPGTPVRPAGERSLSKAQSEAQQSRAFGSMVLGVASVAAYFLLASKLGAGFAIVVGILGVCGLTAVGVLTGPVGRAWARKIEGESAGASAEEIDALYARIEELEGGQQRLVELEERLDFTERMLTRGKDERALSEQGQ